MKDGFERLKQPGIKEGNRGLSKNVIVANRQCTDAVQHFNAFACHFDNEISFTTYCIPGHRLRQATLCSVGHPANNMDRRADAQGYYHYQCK